MPEQRQLTTLMFTDLVGFTRAAQRDEAKALGLLRRHQRLVRATVRRFRGREVKTMGDAFLLEFPSALDAARCAVDLQRSVHAFNGSAPEDDRLLLRIGLHLGDVVRRGRDVVGDAVNVASRIEPLAEPGGICVSEEVYAQIHNKLGSPFEQLEPRPLKNVQRSVNVYKVVLPWAEGAAVAPAAAPEATPGRMRLAILPFENMSPEPADEYFADGLTEEVSMAVSNLPTLEVIARTSVARYKTRPASVGEIGGALRVGWVLEGSVRKAGASVRVAAKLVDVRTEAQVWSSVYDRRLEDILRLQGEIADGIANALRLRLLSAQRKAVERRPTDDVEAYTLLLRAEVLLLNANTEEEVVAARDTFDRVLERDPDCVAAHIGRSRTNLSLWLEGFQTSDEVLGRAEAAARRALEIDPSSSEGYAALCATRLYSWDFSGADRASRRAIELKPNSARAHSLRGRFLCLLRRFEEAEGPALRALALDPLSTPSLWLAGSVYLFWGRPELGIPLFERAIELQPHEGNSRGNLGLCLVKVGRLAEGLAELETADRLAAGRDPMVRADLAWAYAQAGRRDEAGRILAEMREKVESGQGYATALAGLYAIVGEPDRAFAWLERARRDHLGVTPYVRLAVWFDSIRADPRFAAFLERMSGRAKTTGPALRRRRRPAKAPRPRRGRVRRRPPSAR